MVGSISYLPSAVAGLPRAAPAPVQRPTAAARVTAPRPVFMQRSDRRPAERATKMRVIDVMEHQQLAQQQADEIAEAKRRAEAQAEEERQRKKREREDRARAKKKSRKEEKEAKEAAEVPAPTPAIPVSVNPLAQPFSAPRPAAAQQQPLLSSMLSQALGTAASKPPATTAAAPQPATTISAAPAVQNVADIVNTAIAGQSNALKPEDRKVIELFLSGHRGAGDEGVKEVVLNEETKV